MLILAPHATPVLVVGNEGWGYVDISPLELRRVLYQSFSLLAQSRSESLDLTDLFRSEGIDTGTRVGVVGWKYFVEGEGVDPERVSRSRATSRIRCGTSPAIPFW